MPTIDRVPAEVPTIDEVPTIERVPAEVPTIDEVPTIERVPAEVPTIDEVPTIERVPAEVPTIELVETLLASNIPPTVGRIPVASITCPRSTPTNCGSAIAGVKSTPNLSTVARPIDSCTESTLALTNTVVAPAT